MSRYYNNGTRLYRKIPPVTPTVIELDTYKVHISALLEDGFSVTAIIRKFNWGNDLTLRAWLKKNPELDKLRQHNGLMAQKYSTHVLRDIR